MIEFRRFLIPVLVLIGIGTAFARDPDSPANRRTAPVAQLRVGGGIAPGNWEGRIDLRPSIPAKGLVPSGPGEAPSGGGQTVSGPLALRLLESGSGALLDMPAQSMFGFPLRELSWRSDRISFKLQPGSDFSTIAFTGFLVNMPRGGPPRIVGNCRSEGYTGTFSLDPAPNRLFPGESRLSVETAMGSIPGSLILPEDSRTSVPLVIMVAASGTTDRDGNNYNVPGKNDALRMLAEALAREGVASFRYDKRGSGEAYRLVYDESFLRFYQYVDAAAEVISHFRGDERFSRIVMFGHAEGALVASAALNSLGENGDSVDAMMLVCTSDKSPFQGVLEALTDSPPGLRAEADSILQALASGKEYPSPSAYFADFFRPSFQAYLSSWFQYDPQREIPSVAVPVSFVHGGRDLQISREEFDGLAALRPSASAYLLPGMNHALKEVPEDQDRNFNAFTDPSYPLGEGLVELVAAIAKVRPIPASVQRYRP